MRSVLFLTKNSEISAREAMFETANSFCATLVTSGLANTVTLTQRFHGGGWEVPLYGDGSASDLIFEQQCETVVSLVKLLVAQLFKKFPACMGLDGLLH